MRVTRAGDLTQRPLAYSPDGSRILYYQERADGQAGTLGVVGVDGSHRVRLTRSGMTSWCCYFGAPASWSPDGRLVFAAFAAAGVQKQSAVFTAHGDGSDVRRITNWGSWITSARWSPDGRWIAFDQLNRPNAHDLFLVHPDGSGRHQIRTAVGANGSCCAQWSPNSKALLYESGPADGRVDLWIVNIDGTGILRLTNDVSAYLSYRWGP